jgi:3-carboxy-cis,cis-muconate cycloisomerase
MQALADQGAATADQVSCVAKAATTVDPQLQPDQVEDAGTPVLPLVRALRAAVGDPETAAVVHRGLTSQDVLDTALMLLARAALSAANANLDQLGDRLAALADAHRMSVMAGRTLTQYAVPVTFGLRAAQWLVGVLEARAGLVAVNERLPVQCGGAGGTLALVGELVPDPVRAATVFAADLGLQWPGLPWHTQRSPMTRLGDALAETAQALGVIAEDVLVLGRPEIGELRERTGAGRGASSTMPQKQNPILSVLIRSAAIQAPAHVAQLHLCAGQSVDERAPGSWHAEWPALRRLLKLVVTATAQAAELVAGLEVDASTMRARAEESAAELLSERGGDVTDPSSYVGSAEVFVDVALQRWKAR